MGDGVKLRKPSNHRYYLCRLFEQKKEGQIADTVYWAEADECHAT